MSNNSKKSRSVKLVLPPGMRLDRFLAEITQELGISRSRIQKLIEEGLVSGIPEKLLKPSFKAKQDLEIVLTIPAEKKAELIPFDFAIPVLYEDEFLAVVHKPAGMTVHPGAGTGNDTVVHALLSRFDKLAPDKERPGIVHRLDRETEGLLLVAKSDKARTALSAAFAAREIEKHYTAMVWGQVTLPAEISGFISRDEHNRKKMRFTPEMRTGRARAREAELEITAQEQLAAATTLEIRLITGRTHQIRATLAHFHAPVIGDTLYGNDAAKYRLYNIGKEKRTILSDAGMLLMARKLSFSHPFRRKTLRFELPLPDRFAAVAAALARPVK